MLLVKTYIQSLPHKGIGLFSAETIPKGTVIHIEEYELDRVFSNEFVLKKGLTSFFKHYGTYSKKEDNWYLCFDNARFINHSSKPNVGFIEASGESFALTNIPKDNEITVDYTTICDDIKLNGFDFKVS